MVDAAVAAAPRFCTVSVTEKVVPGARTGAGGFADTDVSCRSGRATVTTGAVVARQLLASLLSSTAL